MPTQKNLLQRVSTMVRIVVEDPRNRLVKQIGHGELMALHGREIRPQMDGTTQIVAVTVLLAPQLPDLNDLLVHVKNPHVLMPRQKGVARPLRAEVRRSLVALLPLDGEMDDVAGCLQHALAKQDVLDGEPLLLGQHRDGRYLLLHNVRHDPVAHGYWEAMMRGLLDRLGCVGEQRLFHDVLWMMAPPANKAAANKAA